jgi:hypothetical protein
MSEEGFLRRWARRKSEVREGHAPLPEPVQVPQVPAAVALAEAAPLPVPEAPPAEPANERTLPTMEDVATLDKDSDFSAFVARGVDQAVRRSALKKLFADPHFNVMDRLDVYIDDYTKPSPMSEAMLASLEHAKSVFAKMLEDKADEPEKPEELKPAPQNPPEQETQ